MTDAEVAESLEWHFFVLGNASLTVPQLADHKRRGSCRLCDEAAAAVARVLLQSVGCQDPQAHGPSTTFSSSI